MNRCFSPFFSTSSPGWLFSKSPVAGDRLRLAAGGGRRKGLETKLRFFGLYGFEFSILHVQTPRGVTKKLFGCVVRFPLTLFLTKICNFFYPIYELTEKLDFLFMTMTFLAGTVALNIVFEGLFVDGLIDKDEKEASSKKEQKPYPIYDQYGRKTLPFWGRM